MGADAGRSTMEAAAASSLICGPLFDRRRPQLHRQSLACVSLLQQQRLLAPLVPCQPADLLLAAACTWWSPHVHVSIELALTGQLRTRTHTSAGSAMAAVAAQLGGGSECVQLLK